MRWWIERTGSAGVFRGGFRRGSEQWGDSLCCVVGERRSGEQSEMMCSSEKSRGRVGGRGDGECVGQHEGERCEWMALRRAKEERCRGKGGVVCLANSFSDGRVGGVWHGRRLIGLETS